LFDAERRDNWRAHIRRHKKKKKGQDETRDTAWADKELQKEESGMKKRNQKQMEVLAQVNGSESGA